MIKLHNVARWGVALMICIGIGVITPRPAQAQLGLGGIVFDPKSFAETVLIYKRAYDQLTAAQQQLQEQVTALQKLRNPNWRDITNALSQTDVLMRQQTTLGYGLAGLDAQFQQTFPGTAVLGNTAAQTQTQATRTLATLRSVLDAVTQTTQTFPVGLTRLQGMKAQLGTIQGHEGALELANTVNTYAAEELTLLRQQLATQTNAEAVYFAQQVNRDAQTRATSQAIWSWFAQPATVGQTISYQP
ncbi:MAG TPA: hypothetical protein VNU46_02410 [Gemmatimonadaceae bacterium]|nr:hypothetical protein [Gemmatimonadaceae bacterium]